MTASTQYFRALRAALSLVAVMLFIAVTVGPATGQVLLDPVAQPKYVNPLPIPSVIQPDAAMSTSTYDWYHIPATEETQWLGLVDPITGQQLMTKVWTYAGTFPGPTIEARSTLPENFSNPGKRTHVLFTNDLVDQLGNPLPHPLPIDPTLHCGPGTVDCTPDNRLVAHLHGGHVEAASDGYPEAWYTPGFAKTGPHFVKETYEYSNDQFGSTLWYHDHAMGITRLNVYAGLAGFYLLRDDFEDSLNLPSGEFEIPVVIQDRSFTPDGQLFYPAPLMMTVDGTTVPSHLPEFFGDVIVVNGMAWPFVDVEPRKYRIRFLNGSDSRVYDMWLDNDMPFTQIGSDGGLLPAPVVHQRISMAPAERFDIILDFTGMQGQVITLRNNARSPYPKGATVNPNSSGQIMQFRVKATPQAQVIDNSVIPATLRPITPYNPLMADNTRTLDLQEVVDKYGRLMMTLNGYLWDEATSENIFLNTTEAWTLVNNTPDMHPIHIHQVQFQVVERTKFQRNKYQPSTHVYDSPIYNDAFYNPIGQPYVIPGEEGWKDTVQVQPGEAVTVMMKFDLAGTFVWHCHILSHEDHEMMRPFDVIAPAAI